MIDTQKLLNPSRERIKEELVSVDTEADYHSHYAVGRTDLGYLEDSTRKFREEKLKYEEEEDPYQDLNYHIKMGTMVEQKLLEPDRFEENFIEQTEMNTPSSPNQKEFVNLILTGEFGMVEAHNRAYANSNPSKASKLYEELEDYIEFQSEAANKGVYNQEEKETLIKAVGDIMSHRKASKLLLEDSRWEQCWNQLAVMAGLEDIFCKGLIDRLTVGEDGKFRLIDLKVTSKSLGNFGYHFVRRGYHRQFAMYLRILTQYARMEWNRDITVTPILVATSKEEPYDTIVREVPYSLVKQGGDEIDMLLHRLKWHIKTDNWDRRRDYYEDGIPELYYDERDILGVQI